MGVVIPSEVLLFDEAEGSNGDTCNLVLLRCKDGSFYVGVTMDPIPCVKQHNWGVGAKFYSERRPVELVWWEKLPISKTARQREVQLKGWRREKKLSLLSSLVIGLTLRPQKDATSG
jgi:putative endonuclease